jgi:hypothetical protein
MTTWRAGSTGRLLPRTSCARSTPAARTCATTASRSSGPSSASAQHLAHLGERAARGVGDGGGDAADPLLVVEELHRVGLRDDHRERVPDDVVHVARHARAQRLGVREVDGLHGGVLRLDAQARLGAAGADRAHDEAGQPREEEGEDGRRGEDHPAGPAGLREDGEARARLQEVDGGHRAADEGGRGAEDGGRAGSASRRRVEHEEERDVGEAGPLAQLPLRQRHRPGQDERGAREDRAHDDGGERQRGDEEARLLHVHGRDHGEAGDQESGDRVDRDLGTGAATG